MDKHTISSNPSAKRGSWRRLVRKEATLVREGPPGAAVSAGFWRPFSKAVVAKLTPASLVMNTTLQTVQWRVYSLLLFFWRWWPFVDLCWGLSV